MRMMLQMTIPVEKGNEAARTGAFGPKIRQILEELKPEAAYFGTMANGERGGFIVLDIADMSQLPGIAEPFFLSYNANLICMPVMTPEDLAKGAAGIEKAVKTYG